MKGAVHTPAAQRVAAMRHDGQPAQGEREHPHGTRDRPGQHRGVVFRAAPPRPRPAPPRPSGPPPRPAAASNARALQELQDAALHDAMDDDERIETERRGLKPMEMEAGSGQAGMQDRRFDSPAQPLPGDGDAPRARIPQVQLGRRGAVPAAAGPRPAPGPAAEDRLAVLAQALRQAGGSAAAHEAMRRFLELGGAEGLRGMGLPGVKALLLAADAGPATGAASPALLPLQLLIASAPRTEAQRCGALARLELALRCAPQAAGAVPRVLR